MNYLIDTNALSELRAKQPHPKVVEWFSRQPESTLFLSVLTLGEIRKGIEQIQDGARRDTLRDWLERDLAARFAGRLLSVDADVADRWGRLAAEAKGTLPAIDSLLAATAIEHGMTLVTRNTEDFVDLQVTLLDPWR